MSDKLTMLGCDGIRRSFDEHYVTMMDVEQDPTGALWAIQNQAERIEELEAQLVKVDPDTSKPDYNDGNWHGWNGGKCPVHPKSVVDYIWNGSNGLHHEKKIKVGECKSLFPAVGKYHMIAFRVVKPYVEPKKPREFWAVIVRETYNAIFDNEQVATEFNEAWGKGIIHLREVTE